MSHVLQYVDMGPNVKPDQKVQYRKQLFEKIFKVESIASTVTILLAMAYVLMSRYKKIRWGYSHKYLTWWFARFSPMPFITFEIIQ